MSPGELGRGLQAWTARGAPYRTHTRQTHIMDMRNHLADSQCLSDERQATVWAVSDMVAVTHSSMHSLLRIA